MTSLKAPLPKMEKDVWLFEDGSGDGMCDL